MAFTAEWRRPRPRSVHLPDARKKTLDTIFRIRLPQGDAEALQKMALNESLRRGTQTSWAALMRAALKRMVTDQTPTA